MKGCKASCGHWARWRRKYAACRQFGLAVGGSNLFVTNAFSGTIGEYTMSGATVNAALVSGLNGPSGIAIIPTTVPEPST